MMRLADLIAQFEPDLLARYAAQLLPSQRQALVALKSCRTRFALHMLAACSGCQTQRCLPHSCGHRACPHCQHFESAAWLQRQLKNLVPATYFLVTFTLPAQLRTLAWAHQRVVFGALMRCAWDTLHTFSQNDRQLSGTPGALAVLHTHNRQLGLHPHVHVCMPAAAFDAKERLWRTKVQLGKAPGGQQSARGGYLFNHEALGKVFAAKVRAALADAGLTLPAGLPERWVVDCKAVGDGQAALRYLGRYLYRGVISERDILRCKDGLVTFRYRDAQSGKSATRTLSGAEFLWLLLLSRLAQRLSAGQKLRLSAPQQPPHIAPVAAVAPAAIGAIGCATTAADIDIDIDITTPTGLALRLWRGDGDSEAAPAT